VGKLTDFQLDKLKPKGYPYRVFEKGSDPGFHVQVRKTGKLAFYLAYTLPNCSKRFLSLGVRSSEFGISEARIECRKAQALIDGGTDPQLERSERLAEQEEARKQIERDKQERENTPTVNRVLDHYLTYLAASTRHDASNLFENGYSNIRKIIGKLPITEVTDEQIEQLLDNHVRRDKLRISGKLYAYLRAAFTRAKKHKPFMLKRWRNPFNDIIKPENSDAQAVNRALNENQIKRFWALLERNQSNMMPGMISILRLMLLTGQRVEQTSRIQWADVNLGNAIWDVPAAETKIGKQSGVGHVVPLCPMAIEIIKSAPAFDGEPFIFPGRRNSNPFSLGGINGALKKLLAPDPDLVLFTPRDLRRTCTTEWSRLGVLAEVRNRVQDHAIAGDVESRHYNRHDYLPEKRAALQRWESELMRIIGQPVDNVVQLRG
jgi:integrase